MHVRRAQQRFRTEVEGRTTWHSFSFGAHYDPDNVGFGALVAHNDEWLQAGSGYPDHPHVDAEIVTWVLSGSLRHTDDRGHTAVVGPGQVQRLSAGSGVVHSESADGGLPARFVQAWVRPDESGLAPSYAVADVAMGEGWTTLVGEGAVPINTRGASLHLGVLGVDDDLELPASPRLHVFVTAGSVTLADEVLVDSDAARLVDEPGRPVRGRAPETRLLVWSLP